MVRILTVNKPKQILLPEGHYPFIKTDKHPLEIVLKNGQYMYDMFVKHWRLYKRGGENALNISKDMTDTNRITIGKIYNKLMQNGYRVLDIDETGKIHWGVVTTTRTERI